MLWLLLLVVILLHVVGVVWSFVELVTRSSADQDTWIKGMEEGMRVGLRLLQEVGVVGLTVVGVAFAVSFLLLSVPVGWAAIARRRASRVFICYHHSKRSTADEVRSGLEHSGCLVDVLPFVDKAEHDALLDTIHTMITRSDFVVCVPGLDPSFVEHEVMAAIQVSRPIIFLVNRPAGRLPNTAQKSYPVLDTERASINDFAPLSMLVKHLYGDWRSTVQLYWMPHRPTPWVLWWSKPLNRILWFCIGLLVCVVVLLAFIIFGLEGFLSPQKYYPIFSAAIAGIALICFIGAVMLALEWLLNGISGIVMRHRGMLTVRRVVKRGGFSNDLLRDVFGWEGKQRLALEVVDGAWNRARAGLLEALWTDPPSAHHETGETSET